MNAHSSSPGKMSGFTLLEVLVSVLILAIGLLGLAGLLVQGVRFNHDAYLRSQGSALAYEITDRMRLNRANAGDYVSEYVSRADHDACDPTAASDAANDLNCWYDQIDRTLPPNANGDPSAEIAVNADDANQYDITLRWTSRDEDGPTVILYTFQP
jgi:type IV pilus assembly protein PilV